MEADSSITPLLTPYKLGRFNLCHRIVMPPISRIRSYNNKPQPHAVEYYSQRSTHGGLLISEAAAVSDISEGCPNMPGIWTQEQVEAWKPIVKAVHDKGGIFFCQIWHPGRVSKQNQQTFFYMDREAKDYAYEGDAPGELSMDEMHCIIDDFSVAARNAIKAGFDGVEVHGANGYLIDQFMKGRDKKTDSYSESLVNRCSLALQVVEAVTDEVGADRVGMKLSPFENINGSGDPDPETLGVFMANALSKLGLLYIHVTEPRMIKVGDRYETPRSLAPIRKAFEGTLIATGGYNKADGDKAVAEDYADLVSFGRLFLANPDLPKRFELNAPLNKHDRSTFYTQDPVIGYTDYPFLQVAI